MYASLLVLVFGESMQCASLFQLVNDFLRLVFTTVTDVQTTRLAHGNLTVITAITLSTDQTCTTNPEFLNILNI